MRLDLGLFWNGCWLFYTDIPINGYLEQGGEVLHLLTFN